MFTGAVNGTATAAPLPLVVIVMVWGIAARARAWRLLRWWSGLIRSSGVVDRVAAAAATPTRRRSSTTSRTPTSRPDDRVRSSLRGASNWVNYIYTGSFPTWPAAAELGYTPWLVLASGVLAAVGVIGLVTWAAPWRAPLAMRRSSAWSA